MSNSDAYLQDARNTVHDALDSFDFSNYGLDWLDPDVNPDLSDEWKGDLAAEIVSALNKSNQLWYPKPR